MIKKFNLIILFVLSIFSVSSIDVEVLDTNPSPIIADDYADITIRISIEDGISDLNAYSFVEYGVMKTRYINPYDDYVKVENLNSGETHSRTFRVFFDEKIEEGNITLPIFVRSDRGEFVYEEEVFIEDSLNSPELYIGQIETNPNELLKDSLDNKLTISLQNLGEKDAELVRANLIINNENIEESFSYSLEDSLSEIENGGEESLEFTFDILEEIEVDSLDSTLELRYRAKKSTSDNYEVYEKSIPFKIKLSKTPDIIPTKVEMIDDFKVGSVDNRVKIYIKNIGDKKAEEVRVRLFPDISYPFSFQKLSQYVSFSLDSNEETSIIFETEVFDTAEVRDYPIKILIESLVGDTRYSQEKQIVITTKENKSYITKDNLGYIIFTLVFLFGGYLGLRRFLNSKKPKR